MIGRREWVETLRTKDREEAKRRIPEHTTRTNGEILAARAALARARSPAAQRAHDALELAAYEAEEEGLRLAAEDDARREAKLERLEGAIAFIEARMAGSTAELDDQARAYRAVFDEERFRRRVAEEHLTAARAQLAALSGAALSPAISPAPAPQPASRNPAPKLPIMPLFDRYADTAKMTAGVRKEWARFVASFTAFVGHEDAAAFTTDDVMRWRDALATQPKRGGGALSPRTVAKQVGALRSTLGFAVQERLLPENAAAGVTVRAPRQARLRERSFRSDEATAILAASLVPMPPRTSAPMQRARRWIPWLMAYTGARVNELSQLRGCDVQERDRTPFIRITPEAGTVKSKEAREVPLHPHLIAQGFPAVVKAAGDGPLFYDPGARRSTGDDNRHAKKVGEKLATWVRSEVGIKDRAVQPNHAWRHLFKTLAAEAGMPERITDAIQGHAPATVSRAYGETTLVAKARALDAFPAFTIPGAPPPPHPEGRASEG